MSGKRRITILAVLAVIPGLALPSLGYAAVLPPGLSDRELAVYPVERVDFMVEPVCEVKLAISTSRFTDAEPAMADRGWIRAVPGRTVTSMAAYAEAAAPGLIQAAFRAHRGTGQCLFTVSTDQGQPAGHYATLLSFFGGDPPPSGQPEFSLSDWAQQTIDTEHH
jgi:hypothetical protein